MYRIRLGFALILVAASTVTPALADDPVATYTSVSLDSDRSLSCND